MNDEKVEVSSRCECAPHAVKVPERASWPWGERFGFVFCQQHGVWVGFFRPPLEQ